MKVDGRLFNIFLAGTLLAGLCGCQTTRHKKPVSTLRVHIESNSGNLGVSETVNVLRADPVVVTIAKDPILTEAGIVAARVINTPGGFSLWIQFDQNSALVLEQYTADNPGRHLVIFGQWGDKPSERRWLAAPLITQRISDGILSFTPDMSRTNADRLVIGLNNVAKQNRKGQTK